MLGKLNKLETSNVVIGQAAPCNTSLLEATCNIYCAGFKEHCHRIDWEFHCSNPGFIEQYKCSEDEKVDIIGPGIFKICDGFIDCTNQVDEQNCSNRFYCNNGIGSVHQTQICDTSPDCSDRSDECQVSSDECQVRLDTAPTCAISHNQL